MSVKIMGLVWDLSNDSIDREEKYILLAYADHADHKGYNIFPAVATIAEKTGYKERAVQMITRSLAEKGYLVSDGKGPKGTNKWRVPLSDRGAEIAPANFAGVQKTTKGGAKPKSKGVQRNAPEPSEPSSQPSVKEDKPAVKASDIPELVLFKDVALTYCKPNQRDLVVEAVQKIEKNLGHFPTVADLKPFWDKWRLVSGNPYNLTWLVEWAVAGKIPGKNTEQKPSEPKAFEAIRRFMNNAMPTDEPEYQHG